MGRDHYHAPPQRADLPGYGQSLFAHDRRFDHSLHRFASVKGRNGGHPPRPGPLFNSLIATRSVSLVKARDSNPRSADTPAKSPNPSGFGGPSAWRLQPNSAIPAEGWRPDPSPRQGSGSDGHHHQQLPEIRKGKLHPTLASPLACAGSGPRLCTCEPASPYPRGPRTKARVIVEGHHQFLHPSGHGGPVDSTRQYSTRLPSCLRLSCSWDSPRFRQ